MATRVVVTTQQQMVIRNLEGDRGWSSGICGCCSDCSSCICGLCFPICYLGYLGSKLGELICLPCCTVTPFGAGMALRAKLRYLTGIRGSLCNDCMNGIFCFTCSICQMAREMKQHGIM